MVFQLPPVSRRYIAACLLVVQFLNVTVPAFAGGRGLVNNRTTFLPGHPGKVINNPVDPIGRIRRDKVYPPTKVISNKDDNTRGTRTKDKDPINTHLFGTGGPSQPEMSSFKPAGADNMVDLFTGDFHYNIPLMDVGGYPINIFYNGNISMEQEASWVGLGWNINPGAINRNMRGIPDDFNGDEKLIQTQAMKPNITWGASVGADVELVGIKAFKAAVGASLGVSFNNYLGPALDLSVKGSATVKLANLAKSEKAGDTSGRSLNLSGGLALDLNSRAGFTVMPNLSLGAKFAGDKGQSIGAGLRLSTSYNSRYGIKSLQLSEQTSFNRGLNEHGRGDYSDNEQSVSLASATISFAKPSYIPALRMPITNTSFSGRVQLGSGIFGGHFSAEAEIYKQTSEVDKANMVLSKPMLGYLYYQKARDNENAVMDFTRLNDDEVTPTTQIISAPQYAYDVFSIQGEGTGGTIRAYRNDLGYVRDNVTISKDKSLSLGADISPPGHFGANVNTTKTPTTIGEWHDGNKLRTAIGFQNASGSFENTYFRNPRETSVLNENQYDNIGGLDLVRFKLGGTDVNPTAEPVLEKFSKSGQKTGEVNVIGSTNTDRKKRTQVISFLTAEEAGKIGLDTDIKSYKAGLTAVGAGSSTYYELGFDKINRFNSQNTIVAQNEPVRRPNHISQINVTEANGKRYIYGIPVYNITQTDLTASVISPTTPDADQVTFGVGQTGVESNFLDASSKEKDGYLQKTQTPSYAHAFLLTGLLSPDYVDVTKNGITEDDLGTAVKFNYSKMSEPQKWQTPLSNSELTANFNPGRRSETKDDKGIIVYGERESWYVHSIESKSMIALFTLEGRQDGKGVAGIYGARNNSANAEQRLSKIDLYNKSDLRQNGFKAKPIKTVHFSYSYKLCKNTPDNSGLAEGNANVNKGKLTLERIWFTFNGQEKSNKNQYVFGYENQETPGVSKGNPDYEFNGSDRWNSYKSSASNPIDPTNAGSNLKNSFYPYTPQTKTTADNNAGAWALKKILLPSGGQIEVTYESDDYGFVQNKRAANMMEIKGLGDNPILPMDNKNLLYHVSGNSKITEHSYVFIQVPEVFSTTPTSEEIQSVYNKYLEGLSMLSFKLAVEMPKGDEYITVYANLADPLPNEPQYGICTSGTARNIIWVKLKDVNGVSPLSLTSAEYLRQQLPGQAFKGYDVESAGLAQIGDMLMGWLDGLKGAFQDPMNYLRSKNLAKNIKLGKSFVRLNDADGFKYGGGERVKSIRLRDNWKVMNAGNLSTSEYGQEYDYTTTETFHGVSRTISSGVASYEPSLGGEENPFQTILQFANKLPLGPASYGAIEMPVLDAFFPSPSVGYSKVTVRSINKNNVATGQKSRSGIGKQVTEYYTAKDFPVYYSHTDFDPTSDHQAHPSSFGVFFFKYAFDSRALSQGFVVETNDMHGKLKSQSSFAENDNKSPISYTENFYKNTGKQGLDEKFDFVNGASGGQVTSGNMGIDVELMTDMREFSVNGKSLEIQAQVDLFPVVLPFWLPFIWPVVSKSENTYRAVTTTKVINYHSIVDKVVVIDKGSQVSTQNIAFDAETGNVIVNQTNNEFNQPIYNTSYPAYWAYSGMGLAYKNIDATYNASFLDGKITNLTAAQQAGMFESGDELFVSSTGTVPAGDCDSKLVSSDEVKSLWVFNKHKNDIALTDNSPEFVFMDEKGKLYTRNNIAFRIVRSGKRNLLDAKVADVSSMTSPIATVGGARKLIIDPTTYPNTRVVNATATEYKEKWQTDNDVIRKITMFTDADCVEHEIADCVNGSFESGINPYLKGLFGTFRPYQNKVFYGERSESDPALPTNLRQNGFLKSFATYWAFNTANNLQPIDAASNANRWVFQSQLARVNSKGLELETKDANNIYTSAQYGFNKTVPVAVVNNAAYNEMFSEGFEDANYSETLNGVQLTNAECLKRQRHISFSGMDDRSSIITGNSTNQAHSGKSMLMINPGTSVKEIAVKGRPENSFTTEFGQGVLPGDLVSPGVSIVNFSSPDGTICRPQYHNTVNNIFDFDIVWTLDKRPSPLVTSTSPSDYYDRYTLNTSQYFKVDQQGIYNLGLLYTDGSHGCNFNGNKQTIKLNMEIYDLIENKIIFDNSNPFFESNRQIQSNIPFCFKKGIYRITFRAERYAADLTCVPLNAPLSPCTGQGATAFADQFNASFTPSITGYQQISSSTCSYTKPVGGSEFMLNPVFSIPDDKSDNKMLFSSWMKATGNGNKVSLDFKNSSGTNLQHFDFVPSGPVIEGWQRIEGQFTPPANAITASLGFVNNSGAPIYFDDIRMHPYKANMKSYVYDPITVRLVAELDANNYASLYEYDEEGSLVRTKAETREGIKTITETRSAKQSFIKEIQ